MFRSEESILRTLRDRSSGPGSGLRIDKEQTLHSRPTSLPCLAGFLCGYSLHTATMAYASESDEENENCVRVNCGRHKGRFPSKRHLSVMKNLAKTSKSSIRKQHEPEEEELEPPRKIVTRSKQVMYILFCAKYCCYKKLQISLF